jgi:quinoprotein glucose dehydrogenase
MVLPITALLLLLTQAASGSTDSWAHHGADAASTNFADISQIDSTNFDSLRIIWRWPTPDRALLDSLDAESGPWRSTPIFVDGVLYTISAMNLVSAVDAASGKTLWSFDSEAWKVDGFFHGYARGVSYWTDGEVRRILFGTSSSYLYSLDADTGVPDIDFGERGRVDLTQGLSREFDRRHYGFVSPPVICRDVVITGSSGMDWRLGRDLPALVPPGDVRGFDVRTGKQLWVFHSIPHDDEYGADTWAPGAWQEHGAANVWSMMSVDEELGYVYLPHSTPDNDFYGGERPGDNLFGESLVCLNAATGERVWHYQLVHHGLWDYDLPAAPVLLDIIVDGRPIKAVAQVTKQAFCFVFDRLTGEPVWPIVERSVPASQMPGELASPTQPFPTKPAAFDRQGITVDDLIDFTPEIRAKAEAMAADWVLAPLYTPPSEQVQVMMPGTLGGADWAGAAADPRTGVLYVPSKTEPRRLWLSEPQSSNAAGRFRYVGDARRFGGPWGLPFTKPPYGRLTAIDLNTGEHKWMTPTGRGPKDHPRLRDLVLPDLGWSARHFVIATPTLVLTTNDRLEGGGDYWKRPEKFLRAYDPATGRRLGQTPLPEYSSGPPMTYLVEGRQIVLTPVGKRAGAELVALALPRAGEDLPPQLVERTDAEHPGFYAAVALIDSGDVTGLQALLRAEPELTRARGFTHPAYGNSYFRGASLIHLLANNPTRRSLSRNTLRLAEVLIEAGVDVNAQTDEGNTLLSLAVTSSALQRDGDKTDLVHRLIEAGADPMVPDERTIEQAFVSQSDPDVLEALQGFGFKLDLRRAAGLGDVVALQGFFDDAGTLQEAALHIPGVDLPDSLTTGPYALQYALDLAFNYAARWNQAPAMELLLARGARIDARPPGFYFPGEPGATALHRAADAGRLEAVTWLLEQGADPTLRDLRWDDLASRWSRYRGFSEIEAIIEAAMSTWAQRHAQD